MPKVVNQSDTQLVVHSLKVLNSVTGAGIKEIKDTVETLQSAQTTLAQQARDYWTSISSDGVITPSEKKLLYKEWATILTEYASLSTEADTAGVGTTFSARINYVAAYNAIYNYITVTLKLFDNLTTSTAIEDRTAFNEYYSTYYSTRDTLRSAIYGTNSASTYIIDLTPEMQGISVYADGSVRNLGGSVSITVNLYKGADGTNYAVDYIAYYNDVEIGTWTGNTVSIPYGAFSEDTNYVKITVTDPNGLSLTANATITRLYPGEDGEYRAFDMILSDGAVKVTAAGVKTPTTISAAKYLRTEEEQRETNYGNVKVSVDDGDEEVINGYVKDESDAYTSGASYYQKRIPTLLQLDSNHVLALSTGVAAVMYLKE